MEFPIDFNRKDPLHLHSLINEGNKHTSLELKTESNMIPIILSPEKQKLKEIAQNERIKKKQICLTFKMSKKHNSMLLN